MKKAFTLIELLVVIAIIAILAAILFPVFAQAKNAAKKTQGLNQVKQIGVAMQLYLNDNEDVLPAYRFQADAPATNINPAFLALPTGDPRIAMIEQRARENIFFNQAIAPYTKSKDLFKNPNNPNAWVDAQDKGSFDPGFRSYGGQNSYGVNNYVFPASRTSNPRSGLASSQIAAPSDTLIMVDATYYNVLPRQAADPGCKINGFQPTVANQYSFYWKQLGNSAYVFGSGGNNPTDANAYKGIEARFGGTLNIVRADTSAKALNGRQIANDLVSKGRDSMWDPFKAGCEP